MRTVVAISLLAVFGVFLRFGPSTGLAADEDEVYVSVEVEGRTYYGKLLDETDKTLKVQLVPSRESFLELPVPYGEVRQCPKIETRYLARPGSTGVTTRRDPVTGRYIRVAVTSEAVFGIAKNFTKFTRGSLLKELKFPRTLTLRVKQIFRTKPASGKIAKVDSEDRVYVTLGYSHGVTKGQSLDVYRVSGVVVDPDTGQPLGNDVREIGKLEVLDSRENYCTAKLTKKEVPPQVGDLVEPTIKKSAIVVLPLVARGKTSRYQGEYAEELAQELISDLVNADMTIVDRDLFLSRLKSELGEQHHAETKFGEREFDKELVRRVGKLVGATAVLGGTLTLDSYHHTSFREYIAHLRLVSVETGEILLSHTVKLTDLKDRGKE